ncbi:hypothetical protein [Stenotrophomonas oahuensis]|uniref:Phosphopyruvate hydratase n=1 Tax=Stenotrophomonas oahuensis TaxID=3003271 RepID=A0ABY9YSR2_9GAMM|nr:hypothetical protein [Stenotrophomonas sp. A5586]WNH53219.1 hypothetical protein PDM29_02785 [Stenotrophomonas sp. A5586]
MEVDVPEISAGIIGLHPDTGQEAVLADSSSDENTLENLEASIRRVAESVKSDLGDVAEAWHPRLAVRVWSREGLRPCLNLSADTIRLIASISACLDFAPNQRNEYEDGAHGQDEPVLGNESQSPELVVLFIGDSPETGSESVIAKVVCQHYSLESLQACISESVALAQIELGVEASLWNPQVGVRLSSDRAISPALCISAGLVQQIASCGASLDFDPYV